MRAVLQQWRWTRQQMVVQRQLHLDGLCAQCPAALVLMPPATLAGPVKPLSGPMSTLTSLAHWLGRSQRLGWRPVGDNDVWCAGLVWQPAWVCTRPAGPWPELPRQTTALAGLCHQVEMAELYHPCLKCKAPPPPPCGMSLLQRRSCGGRLSLGPWRRWPTTMMKGPGWSCSCCPKQFYVLLGGVAANTRKLHQPSPWTGSNAG